MVSNNGHFLKERAKRLKLCGFCIHWKKGQCTEYNPFNPLSGTIYCPARPETQQNRIARIKKGEQPKVKV